METVRVKIESHRGVPLAEDPLRLAGIIAARAAVVIGEVVNETREIVYSFELPGVGGGEGVSGDVQTVREFIEELLTTSGFRLVRP